MAKQPFAKKKVFFLKNGTKIAVFLDRDGTINIDAARPWLVSRVKPYSFSAKAISLLKKAGFKVIIVSNQAKIARGVCSEKKVRETNKRLLAELGEKGAVVDALYFCPHHPTEAVLEKYAKKCDCRKPGIGMLEKAKKRFGIILAKSFFVGDSTIDIQTGKNAGCKTILVLTGHARKDRRFPAKPDFVARNLLGAARIIVRETKK